MKRSKKIWIAVIVLIVIAVAAFGIARSRGDKGVEVTTATVSREDLVSKVSANGRIQAERKVDLSAHVMGQIINLAVREGDVVQKGDVLLQIDRAQLAASAAGAAASLNALFSDRDAARAAVAEALRNYERAQRNHEEKIIPLAEFESARTALQSARASAAALDNRIEQARAGLAGARDTLSKTTITAPMNGIVTALPVEEGEVAVIGTMNNPGTILMTISDMSTVEAVMEVDETDIPNVQVGQRASVTIDPYPNQTFAGTVTEVASSPITRAGTGTEAVNFEVKIQLENPPANLRPGFSASADIITNTQPKALAIPIQALVVREKPGAAVSPGVPAVEEEGVYLLDEPTGTVKFVPVETGITGDISIEITKGLTENQKIVSGPFRALREIEDGDKVKESKKGGGKDAG